MKLYKIIFLFIIFYSNAHAQPASQSSRSDIKARFKIIENETQCYLSPGPDQGQRALCVWRPSVAAKGTLPVIYLTDGIENLLLTSVHLKPLIETGRIRPFMIVSMAAAPDIEARGAEYLMNWESGDTAYRSHEEWMLKTVIPWAERTQGAAPIREERFIGGFSNGADYAVSIAGRHPDMFAGVMAHSPVRAVPGWLPSDSSSIRWVITGGTKEKTGTIQREAELPRAIADVLLHRKAKVRTCIGPWKHEGRAWRLISPGSIVWMMELGNPKEAQTDVEEKYCH